MSLSLLDAYVARLPPLDAGESLQWATRLAVGTGVADKADRERVWASWEGRADTQPAIKAATGEQYAAAVGGMGIGVVIDAGDPPVG